MNQLDPSPAIKAMLEAARLDRPSSAARAKMWTGVSGAVGGGAVAGAGAAVGLTKMMSTGTLFGGVMTVGVAAALLYVGHTRGPDVSPMAHASVVAAARAPAAAPFLPVALTELPTERGATAFATREMPATKDSAVLPRAHLSGAQNAAPPFASLARESTLLANAQAALVRGDGASALHAIDAACALPGRQLVPEELAVRAGALHLLGRTKEAKAADAALKANYPLSALVRGR